LPEDFRGPRGRVRPQTERERNHGIELQRAAVVCERTLEITGGQVIISQRDLTARVQRIQRDGSLARGRGFRPAPNLGDLRAGGGEAGGFAAVIPPWLGPKSAAVTAGVGVCFEC